MRDRYRYTSHSCPDSALHVSERLGGNWNVYFNRHTAVGTSLGRQRSAKMLNAMAHCLIIQRSVDRLALTLQADCFNENACHLPIHTQMHIHLVGAAFHEQRTHDCLDKAEDGQLHG